MTGIVKEDAAVACKLVVKIKSCLKGEGMS